MSSTYSFKDVAATIVGPGGAFDLGYGAAVADEGISIDMAGDKNTMMIGADGKGMHSLHADNSGTITVRLLKVSPVNQQLMAMYDTQKVASSTWGINTIAIRQIASGDVTIATQCAFKRKPNLTYRKDGDVVEWTFETIHINTVLGKY